MTPVNLGDLPSNEAAPTGLVQIRRGVVGAGQVQWSDHSPMYENVGSPWPMYIYISTGNRPGWWVIRAETIFSMADAAWYYFHWYIHLSQADENGVQDDHNYKCQHSALSWQQSCLDTAFKLKANAYYEATMYYGGRSGGTVYRWCGADYTYIKGEFIAEGSL